MPKMTDKEYVLSQIKTVFRILNTYGNCLVPSLPGKEETYAKDRLTFFVEKAQEEYKMSLDEIDIAIA